MRPPRNQDAEYEDCKGDNHPVLNRQSENLRVEFMIGVGPQVSYATFGGGTKVAGEIELEWMLWPSAERKFGWFVAPTYGYSFSKGHEQSIGIATGLIIAIH